jgi:hypothetical protein
MLTIVTVAHADKPNLLLPIEPAAEASGADLRVQRSPQKPRRPATYFDEHSAHVSHDMLFFEHGYTLGEMRERDALRLYGPTPGNEQSGVDGAALLAGTIVVTAHAPRPIRRLLDGRWHVGPAILYGGGMGAGAGGRF